MCEEPNEHFGVFNGTLYLDPRLRRPPPQDPPELQDLKAPLPEPAATSAVDKPTSAEAPRGSAAAADVRVVLDANNMLLRGCVLRNVEYIYGLVVYTGNEAKVRVKQQAKTTKKPSIERKINVYIVYLVGFLLALCIGSSLGYYFYSVAEADHAWYLVLDPPSGADTTERFFTFLLVISNIVPLSLYVSMKLTRTAQKLFMDFDLECVYVNEEELKRSGGESGRYPLSVRVMDLNDELGQITHLFTDKTGTLTSNYMEFRKMSINGAAVRGREAGSAGAEARALYGATESEHTCTSAPAFLFSHAGIAYGLGTTQIGLARRRRNGEDISKLQALMDRFDESGERVPHVNFIDGCEDEPGRVLLGPVGDLCGAGALRDPDQSAAVRLFLFQLAINHTVVIENLLDKDTHAVTGTQLSASSPDEEAFVLAAAFFGMTFSKRSKDVVTLEIRGKPFAYRIVAMLPYTPMRKMMSLIVEDLQATAANDSARRFVLLCKGADSKILSLLDDGSENPAGGFSARRGIVESTKRHMEEWAKDGLRTLCFGCKPLPERDLERWLDEYNEFLSDISERQKMDAKQPNRIDAHMDALETGLTLQGATANEDKLQEQVPETIARLAEAGIKVFMLTGDKQETAVNVGFAASMLTNEFERILLTSEEIADLSLIPQLLESKADEVREMVRLGRESSSPLSIVLDEPVIDLVMRNAENRRNFLVIVEACKTVICCRCRPDQKKQVVQLVRLGVKGSCTLAIGDGANDVDMILEANVGVGIIGAEGVQAANSSDYSIGRFRFLQRLLLVHGRWNYMRMSMVRARWGELL